MPPPHRPRRSWRRTRGERLEQLIEAEDGAFRRLGDLFLVFPAILGAILRPLLGVDVGAFVPGLSGLGLRVGYNVLPGFAVFAAAAAMQRMRTA